MNRSLAALVVLAVGAAALTPSSCTARSENFDASLTATCYSVTGAHTATVTVPRRLIGTNFLEVLVWNINDVAAFTAASVATLPASTVPTSALAQPGGGNPLGDLFTVNLADAAFDGSQDVVVEITFTGAAPAGLHLEVVSAATAAPAITVSPGSSATLNARLDLLTTIAVTVDAPFATQQYIVQTAEFNFNGNDDNSLSGVSAAPELTAVSATATPSGTRGTTVKYGGDDDGVNQPTTNVLNFAVAVPADYDLAQSGPFVTGFVSMSVSEYPVVGPSGSFDVLEGQTETYRVDLPLLWIGVTARSNANTNPAADTTVSVAMNPATAAAIVGAPAPVAPRTYTVTPGGGLDSYELLAPLKPATPSFVFVRATSTTGGFVVYVDVESVAGECSSYVDCRDVDSSSPSFRSQRSANDDSRFVHCALVPSIEDPTVPSTTCIECLNDCDCGGGQYCHKDDGLCAGALCDLESRRSLGLCQKKDPTNVILGEACRSTGGTPKLIDAVTDFAVDFKAAISSPADLPLIEGPAVHDLPTDSGVGFCGQALYYPADESVPAGTASRALGARAILWEGQCYNGVCSECLGDGNTCSGAQQCVDGSLMDTIVVDGTARTFGNNVVAGVGLGVILMVILLQCCVCARMLQARSYRKEDRSEAGKDQKAAVTFI